MLAAAQGQNRSTGRPLRSASSMTLMPLVSIRPTAVVRRRRLGVAHPSCTPLVSRAASTGPSRPAVSLGGRDDLVRVGRVAAALDGRHGGEAGHLHPTLSRRDRLRHRRHADEVGAHAAQPLGLGGGVVVRADQLGVDALGERRVERAGDGAQARRPGVGEVDEVRALDRRDPGQVEVVGDQDGSTDLPLGDGGEPLALVSTATRAPRAAAVRTPCTTGPRAVALVEVGAARQDQHRDAVEVVAEQLAAVALGDRPPEVRDVGDLGAQVRLGPVGDGRRPAGAEHHEGVVRRSAALGDPAGRLARVVEGVRHQVRIARWRPASATRCPSRASSLSRNSGPPSRPSTTRPSSPRGAAQCRVTSSVLGSRAALTTSAQATSRGGGAGRHRDRAAVAGALETGGPVDPEGHRQQPDQRVQRVRRVVGELLDHLEVEEQVAAGVVAADPHDLDPLERGAGRHDRVGHPAGRHLEEHVVDGRAVVPLLDDLDRLDVAARLADGARQPPQRTGDVGQRDAQQEGHGSTLSVGCVAGVSAVRASKSPALLG